jgi:hypothetical protein
MYDPIRVLAAIDQHKWQIIALCSLAMVCNYTWFFAAVLRGFRDRVYPIPIFCTLFWLVGDGSMVMRYDLWFNGYGHWYVELFWLALVFTVACELVFLYMTLRFGREELMPSATPLQFRAVVLGGLVVMAVTWVFLKAHLGDDLYISYFHLANMAGPPFAAALLIRRRSLAGTRPLIWGAYTVMVASWFIANALWFGAPFDSPMFLVFYAVCTAASAGLWAVVSRMPAYAAPDQSAATGVPSAGAGLRTRKQSGRSATQSHPEM